MEHCPICSQPLVPFRAKLVCRTPGCGFMENCCDGGWMSAGGERSSGADERLTPAERRDTSHPRGDATQVDALSTERPSE